MAKLVHLHLVPPVNDRPAPMGALAAEAERRRQLRTYRRTARCGSCGCFKPRPSSECGQCGDEPVTHNATVRERFEYDRAHGWDVNPR